MMVRPGNSRVGRSFGQGLAIGLVALSVALCGAQDSGDAGEDEAEVTEYSGEQLAQIRKHFVEAASPQVDASGKLSLTYDFESVDHSLSDDWMDPERTKGKVSWTRGDQGSAEGARGIVLADRGRWFHNTSWDKVVNFKVEFVAVVSGSKNVLLAAVYTCNKGKVTIGNNGGAQLVKLVGFKKATQIGEFIPLVYSKRFKFGFNLKEGELQGTKGAAVGVSTDSKKFLKKITPGHVGLVWSGNISVYVTKVEIEGMLHREWVEKTILKMKKRKKKKK